MSARVVKKGYLLSGYTKQGDPVRVKVRASIGKVPNGNMEWLYVVLADSQFAWIKGLPEGKGFLMQTLPLYGPEEDWSDQIQAYYAKLPKEDGFETSVPAGAEIELFGDSYYIIAG